MRNVPRAIVRLESRPPPPEDPPDSLGSQLFDAGCGNFPGDFFSFLHAHALRVTLVRPIERRFRGKRGVRAVTDDCSSSQDPSHHFRLLGCSPSEQNIIIIIVNVILFILILL